MPGPATQHGTQLQIPAGKGASNANRPTGSFVGGLKQGWAFAWRSLMAGELLVLIAHEPSIGVLLENDQNTNSAAAVIAIVIVIIVIGMLADSLFGVADRGIRHRRGISAADRSLTRSPTT